MTNKEIVQNLYAAFKAGDIPSVLAAFSSNISWTEAEGFPYGGIYSGPEAVLQNVFMKLGTEWDGFAVRSDQLVAEDDTVVSIGEYSGRYKATGRAMCVPCVHVWKIEGGKILKFVQHTDTKLVADQIGWTRPNALGTSTGA